MKLFELFKNKTKKRIDRRIDVPQEFKDLYRALAIIERNNWDSEEYKRVADLRVTITKYSEEGFSMFDELYELNRKYRLDEDELK